MDLTFKTEEGYFNYRVCRCYTSMTVKSLLKEVKKRMYIICPAAG